MTKIMENFGQVFTFILLFIIGVFSPLASSQTSTFEVGDALLPMTTAPGAGVPTPFTTVSFDSAFAAPPNVFVVTLENAANPDPCVVRIRNVTTTGFDATCLEPINEDRAAGGMMIEYIAIQDGETSVPLADGSGNVRFESNCSNINNQVFGPNCNNCSGAQSFVGVSFTPAFTAAPALLTQLQTTNNQPTGEPIFIEPAVQTGSLSASGFSLALDQLEAGTGPVSNTEEVCYLAAERAGCQELDFSSLNGPDSVFFQANTSATDVDGHDDGCNAGEGVDFAAGCFSTTPIAVTKAVTRRGNNGGFARRCLVNTSEIRVTIDEDQVSDGERSHIDEQVSAFAFGSIFTTPVTLTSAQVKRLSKRARFEWQTSSESFHLGFHLWGETGDGWVQLNNRLIAGQGKDTNQTANYRFTVRLNKQQNNEITNFGISTIDHTGYEEFFGPFNENQEYGEQANSEPVDWTATRAKFERSMRLKGLVNINGKWRKVSAKRERKIARRRDARNLNLNNYAFDLGFETTGIHSLAASKLLALNPQWNGTLLSNIALTLNGSAMPRHIISEDAFLDTNDRIIFNVVAPKGDDATFLENYTYRLKIDKPRAIDASIFDATVTDGIKLEDHALFAQTLTSRKQHSAILTTGDPWYDARLLSINQPGSTVYTFDFAKPINADKDAELEFVLFGGIDLPDAIEDHHAQVWVNDTLIKDVVFDGMNAYSETIRLNAGLLKQSGNNIKVVVPGDTGGFADLILVDQIHVSVPVELRQDNANQVIDFAANKHAQGYQLYALPNDSANDVYAYTDNGSLSRIKASATNDLIKFASFPLAAGSSLKSQLRYAIAAPDAWPQPSTVSVTKGKKLHELETDYLVIAHPNFIGDTLDDFVNFKAEQGYQPRVVDWLEIVNTYGYGNNTPTALENYLERAAFTSATPNVLIVGGHTFDYFGITNEDIVNFIPAPYRRVSIYQYTPTDNPYADLNGDGIPEIAFGRWPVRNLEDLSFIVKKTKAWHTNRNDEQYIDALLVAQATDGKKLDFEEQLEGRLALPLTTTDNIDEVHKIYLSSAGDTAENSVAAAREKINEAINQGAELLSFVGHGSPVSWGYRGVVNTDFIRSLSNSGKPILVMPLACYITYYEGVSSNSLAHQWLFAGDTGAVAVHGAAVLGEHRENGVFAERYLTHAKTHATLGGAILQAKQEMSGNNQLQNNWSLLGDPTLPLR